ncbi:hypothetical protein JAAARDRAFT_188485 [Jaapia argillacea MUCL 33604]|uniref:Uncharacterized protein n=1 Tax=Jaapia argillacea MUCL 33604 TaxID=933084 RepID=A0A067QH44_9AGAM|nr:hypothetical protein JAAARDRAFT_188485 [Jaapia argillacea MUCL 33604]
MANTAHSNLTCCSVIVHLNVCAGPIRHRPRKQFSHVTSSLNGRSAHRPECFVVIKILSMGGSIVRKTFTIFVCGTDVVYGVLQGPNCLQFPLGEAALYRINYSLLLATSPHLNLPIIIMARTQINDKPVPPLVRSPRTQHATAKVQQAANDARAKAQCTKSRKKMASLRKHQAQEEMNDFLISGTPSVESEDSDDELLINKLPMFSIHSDQPPPPRSA